MSYFIIDYAALKMKAGSMRDDRSIASKSQIISIAPSNERAKREAYAGRARIESRYSDAMA